MLSNNNFLVGRRLAQTVPQHRCRSNFGRMNCSQENPLVVVTRESGKNNELISKLTSLGIETLEMPLIEAIPGPEKAKLPEVLQQYSELNIGWTCLTSPEGASVFLDGWKKAGKPQVKIACVGKGTAKILQEDEECDLEVGFMPSKANAVHLGFELPRILTKREEEEEIVLYPTSVRATKDLQQSLTDRGFAVIRLNTYNTVGVTHIDQEILSKARSAEILAVASPSALKAWTLFADDDQLAFQIIACIGETSAKAAAKEGFQTIVFPESPGVDGWVETIRQSYMNLKSIVV